MYCTGTYIDKKCPFTGNVSIRGRILSGALHAGSASATAVKLQHATRVRPWCRRGQVGKDDADDHRAAKLRALHQEIRQVACLVP